MPKEPWRACSKLREPYVFAWGFATARATRGRPHASLALVVATFLASCSTDAGRFDYATELRPTQSPGYYVAQAELYFDTLDTRADPNLVPNYAPLVARWEWPPWLLLTGYERQNMIDSTRAALALDPSTVTDRDCRFFEEQPFARCRVVFQYGGGACPIYEEFTFDDEGEMTFIEAWSDQPGMLPSQDPNDLWAEGRRVHRLSTRIPGLGNATGTIDLTSPEMLHAAARDPEVADFVARATEFWFYWLDALGNAGSDYFARGCGW